MIVVQQQQHQPPTGPYEQEGSVDYSQYYQQQQLRQASAEPSPATHDPQSYGYEEWSRSVPAAAPTTAAADNAGAEPPPQPYGDSYWQGDSYYDEVSATLSAALHGRRPADARVRNDFPP